MNLHATLLLLAMGAATIAPAVSALDIGGFGALEVGDKETELLTKVLADDALYAPTLETRACFVEIESLGSQVVSGTKYKYTVKGCMTTTGKSGAGKCAGESANCKAEPLVITVFDQPWTETLQVLTIDKATDGATDDKKEDDKKEETTASSTGGDGSADEEAPVMVTTTDGSMSDKAEEATTEKPAANATTAPSSAVPSPAPTSGAATISVMSAASCVVALGVAYAM